MLKPASHYRIDWRSEFTTLDPYLKGKGGVVGVEYGSEEAAPEKFNYLIKEGFIRSGNQMWSSLRVDHDWFTTRKVPGILDELDRLLTEAGYPAERTQEERYALSLFSGNDIEGNLTSNWENVTFQVGSGLTGAALRARVRSVSDAMRRYISCGGHFMIVVNDTPIPDQSGFWQDIWLGGLADACGESLLLVIHAGPKARREYHIDSPRLDARLNLPSSVESEDSRQYDVYDDLFEVFRAEGFENPAECATTHLTATMSSVRQLHLKLSAAIMNKSRWIGKRKA